MKQKCLKEGFLAFCWITLQSLPTLAAEGVPSIFKETRCFGDTVPIVKPPHMPPPPPWDPGDPGPIPTCGITGVNACGKPRDWFQNPFSASSAHHRPIGTGAIYASDDDPSTLDWLRASPLGINPGAPWGVSVATTVPGDPIRTIGAGPPNCDRISGLPVSIPFPAGGFITKVSYNRNHCTDGVSVIYDCASGIPHQLRQYDWNNGNPVAGQYRTWGIRALGHGTHPGDRIGTSASGVAALFGILRGYEINTPGLPIGHALQMVAPRTPGCNQLLSKEFVLPAVSTDGSADAPGNNLGHIPYGGLMAIPRDVNLASLSLSDPGLRLAQALQNYGVYLVDGGGCNNGAIRGDQFISPSSLNAMKADMPKFYRLMRMVKNNDVHSPIAGGGTALAPNCAADSP